jgi:pimeloyl-ACP methyl ester carboxylesterase
MAYLDQRLAQLDTVFPQRNVDVAGATIAYRESCTSNGSVECGSVPVVALHGIGSGAASWLDVALGMAGNRFIAWDAPGYGPSTPLSQERPLATDYAAALEGFLAALRIERCVLVGHSLGALMAAGFLAGKGSQRVEQAVLISPARGYGADAADSLRVRSERMQTLEALGVAEMARLRSSRLLSEFATDEMREWVRWNMANLNPPGYRQAIELLCGDDITRYAPTSVPVAVHCGAQDVVTPPAACEEVAQKFGTTLSMIERAGHASPCEAAPTVARIILDCFQKSRQTQTKAHPA